MNPSKQGEKAPLEIAKELGEHIFRWGLSCQGCTPDEFKSEMSKAIKQLDAAITSAVSLERAAISERITDLIVNEGTELGGFRNMSAYDVLSHIKTAIRLREKKGEL